MDRQDIERTVARIVEQVRSQQTHSAATGADITLEQALELAGEVRLKAREIGVNAVIAISDSACRPVLVQCMDGCLQAAYDIAVNKAYTVTAMRMSTSQLKTLAQPGGSLYGIQHTNGGRIVIFGGGELLQRGGLTAGGLGVSGGTEEQDTYLAKYGKGLFK